MDFGYNSVDEQEQEEEEEEEVMAQHGNDPSSESLDTERDLLEELTVKELKKRLKEEGLRTVGNKDELIERLLRPERETIGQLKNGIAHCLLTADDILVMGLSWVNINEKRQQVRQALNVERFKSFFGVEPSTLKDVYSKLVDLCDVDDVGLKEFLMLVEWLNKYDTESGMTSRWGWDEKHIGRKLKKVGKQMQSASKAVIVLDLNNFDPKEVIIVSVDCVNYATTEFRLDPSTMWFDHKSHGPGLKYEFGVCVHSPYCVWIRGPFPAGKYNDLSVFLGKESEGQPQAEWNRDALFWKIPSGKKAVADRIYAGCPQKVMVKRDGHPVWVQST
ncbi:hypothetical protein QTG54_004945 [Skeletonema marinoi]|uniref:SAP domain-containing protein n=1 Tax=Skeletonema marinoi TaxID=267567 RepID=A0AAD8YFD3_9STRA|nr:hypothetical protein QTG54_004945 [Skeletonema marinoi]